MKNVRKTAFLAAVIFSAAMFFTSCGGGKGSSASHGTGGKVLVYSSFYAMYDLAEKIGGDKIVLSNLVPAGMEPHDWEPSPGDMVNLEKADVLILNGASMEGWADKVIPALNNKKLVVVVTSTNIKLHENLDKNENLKYDPHVWLYPLNAVKQMEEIEAALTNADPADAEFFRSNLIYYTSKFTELDRGYREALKDVGRRTIIVSHQAFGYMCEAYGLKQIPIEGLEADAEPSAGRMALIADFARKNGVKYIFFEDLVSPKVAQAIAREIGAKAETFNPLEGLTDKEIAEGKEYISVMKDNLATLVKALRQM
ncbi:MAG: metal ABC transporter substrate-binding protein [Brevinematales bacterium]|jgi:zinc transport system substrate-binding protein